MAQELTTGSADERPPVWRERAEAAWRLRALPAEPPATPDQLQRVVYELQIHQIELEMQNEELRRVQEELETSRNKYFDLYDLAPVGYLTLSDKRLIQGANLALATLLGVERANLVKQPLTRFILPADQDLFYHHLSLLDATDVQQACELRLIRPGGAPCWVHFETILTPGGAGGLPCYWVTVHDISARKLAEEKLRASTEQFNSLFDNAPLQGVIYRLLRDAQGEIVDWEISAINPLGAASLGRPASVLIGQRASALYGDEVMAPYLQLARRVAATGQAQVFETHFEANGRDYLSSVFMVGAEHYANVSVDITAIKRAEQARRDSEDKYRLLYETMVQGVVFQAADGQIIHANPAAEQILGLTLDQMQGRTSIDPRWKAFHEDGSDFPGETHPAMVALQTGQAVRNVIMGVHNPVADSHRWISVSAVPRFNPGADRPYQVYATFDDITERKHAEEERQHLERWYKALIEHAPDAIVLIHADGKFKYISPAAERNYGYRLEDLRDVDAAELTHPDDRAAVIATLVKLLADPRYVPTLQYRFLHADGSWRWVETTFSNLLAVPSVEAIVINSHDIHELKTAQQELLELNRTLEARVQQLTAEVQDLYDNAPAGYHSLDADGNLMMINVTELNWLGYTRAEVIGRRLTDFFTPASQAVFAEDFPAFKARGWSRDQEFEFVRKNGSVFPILVNSTAIYDEQGSFVMSRSTVHDNTAPKAANEALRRANLEMERALRMKDEFLANMSHELRTPLTGVLALSEVMQQQIYGPLNERQLHALANIETSGRHLLALINDILDLAKIEAGNFELHVATVAVEEICRASLAFVRSIAVKKNIQLSYQSNEPEAVLRADPFRLKQMLFNLLSNAIKFTPEGGRVELAVRVQAATQQIRFAVQDTGVGIAPADLPKLFQMFTQLDATLARQYEGTGLGLALVKRLALQHGGDVRAESAGPGQGSCFVITLPYVAAAEVPAVASVAQPGPARAEAGEGSVRRGPWVLLVEDNEVSIDALRGYLEYLGYRPLIARTGPEALDSANAQPPDLILMDIQLPGLDGLEVTRRLRRDPRFGATPIIALTALAMLGDRERCLQAGATAYLSKPLHLPELAVLMERLLQPRP